MPKKAVLLSIKPKYCELIAIGGRRNDNSQRNSTCGIKTTKCYKHTYKM